MKKTYLAVLLLLALELLAPLALDQSVDAQTQTFTLPFLPTQNAPAGAQAVLTIQANPSQTLAKLNVSGLYPNTVYTLWTVFNVLNCPLMVDGVLRCSDGPEVPAFPAAGRSGFPLEGNGVSPTAPLGSGFTSGMGLDPGVNVITNNSGNGSVTVQLDFDLISKAPVSNRDIILQCAPGPAIPDDTGKPICPAGSKTVRVTTTWLRRFIGEFPLDQRAAACVNYDSQFDQDR